MKRCVVALVAAITLCAAGEAVRLYAQDKPQIQIPNPGVPQIMTMEGKFVRAAYNNRSLRSSATRWPTARSGTVDDDRHRHHVLDNTPAYVMKREALSLETPDGKTIPMATMTEYRSADCARARTPRHRAARFDQFPADGEPGLPHRPSPTLGVAMPTTSGG